MADPGSKGSRKVVYAGIAGNLAVAITKFAAAYFTHSSAMLSEAVHSLVDTGNQVVMLHGINRSEMPADKSHPLGYGREVYFWSFVVAVLIFAVGAGVSVYEGIQHLIDPQPMRDAWINYAVLGVAAAIEFASWTVALREFRRQKRDLGYFEAAEETKDPSTLTLLLEDSAALIGIAIAALGTLGTQLTGNPVYDGAASVAIGVLLGLVAIFLARETKRLIIGEPADRKLVEAIRASAAAQSGVDRVNGVLTIHLGPRSVVVALSLEFNDALRVPEIERAVEELETRICESQPLVTTLFVKPERAAAYEEARRALAPQPPAS
jgi:cation diffusion facilitator family transporter